MLDRAGRLVHIDFGYMLGRTPGGLNFEDAPFKLPDEYVRVLGGVGSDAWVAFSTALAGGLHALAADLHELQTTLALFFGDAPFGADAARKLGDRFADLDGDPQADGRGRDGDDPPVAQLGAREAVRLVPVADERHRALSLFFVIIPILIRRTRPRDAASCIERRPAIVSCMPQTGRRRCRAPRAAL